MSHKTDASCGYSSETCLWVKGNHIQFREDSMSIIWRYYVRGHRCTRSPRCCPWFAFSPSSWCFIKSFQVKPNSKSIIGKYLIWSLHPRSLSISVRLCFRVLCFDSNKIQCLSLADILMPVSHSVFSLVLYVTQKSSKLKVMSIQQTFQGVWGHLRRRLHWRNSEEVPRGELNIYVCLHT